LKQTEKFSALRAAFFRKNPCISTVQRRALRRSRRELSNAYLLAKFGLHTAENEPLQDCKFPSIFAEISAKLSTSSPTVSKISRRGAVQKLGERVVFGKSCTLRILLQNLASTQPRTSPAKSGRFWQIFGIARLPDCQIAKLRDCQIGRELRSIKNQNSIFFLIFKDFKIFIAREARPP
jgi:hypothetical protein